MSGVSSAVLAKPVVLVLLCHLDRRCACGEEARWCPITPPLLRDKEETGHIPIRNDGSPCMRRRCRMSRRTRPERTVAALDMVEQMDGATDETSNGLVSLGNAAAGGLSQIPLTAIALLPLECWLSQKSSCCKSKSDASRSPARKTLGFLLYVITYNYKIPKKFGKECCFRARVV